MLTKTVVSGKPFGTAGVHSLTHNGMAQSLLVAMGEDYWRPCPTEYGSG